MGEGNGEQLRLLHHGIEENGWGCWNKARDRSSFEGCLGLTSKMLASLIETKTAASSFFTLIAPIPRDMRLHVLISLAELRKASQAPLHSRSG